MAMTRAVQNSQYMIRPTYFTLKIRMTRQLNDSGNDNQLSGTIHTYISDNIEIENDNNKTIEIILAMTIDRPEQSIHDSSDNIEIEIENKNYMTIK